MFGWFSSLSPFVGSFGYNTRCESRRRLAFPVLPKVAVHSRRPRAVCCASGRASRISYTTFSPNNSQRPTAIPSVTGASPASAAQVLGWDATMLGDVFQQQALRHHETVSRIHAHDSKCASWVSVAASVFAVRSYAMVLLHVRPLKRRGASSGTNRRLAVGSTRRSGNKRTGAGALIADRHRWRARAPSAPVDREPGGACAVRGGPVRPATASASTRLGRGLIADEAQRDLRDGTMRSHRR